MSSFEIEEATGLIELQISQKRLYTCFFIIPNFQLIEKTVNHNNLLVIIFIDFPKAFDNKYCSYPKVIIVMQNRPSILSDYQEYIYIKMQQLL